MQSSALVGCLRQVQLLLRRLMCGLLLMLLLLRGLLCSFAKLRSTLQLNAPFCPFPIVLHAFVFM